MSTEPPTPGGASSAPPATPPEQSAAAAEPASTGSHDALAVPADVRFAGLRGIGAETLRYVIVAAFGFSWILLTSALWVEVVGLPERAGVAIALVTALAINFSLLRLFVWPGQEAHIGAQFAAAAVTSLSFRFLEYLLFLFLIGSAGVHYLPATALSVLASAVIKFLIYRNIVFRRPG